MSSGRNEAGSPHSLVRLTEDSAGEKQSANIDMDQAGSVCYPVQGDANRFEHTIRKPLTRTRDTQLIIRDSRGRIVGSTQWEECISPQCVSPHGSSLGLTDDPFITQNDTTIRASAGHDRDDDHEQSDDKKSQPRNMTANPSAMQDPNDPNHAADNIAKPNESGDRVVSGENYIDQVNDSRDDVELALALDEEDAQQSEGAYETAPASVRPLAYSELAPPKYEDRVEVEEDVLRKMAYLLEKNTLESHEQAMELLKGSGLLAVQRWEDIHSDPNSRHNFSTVSSKRVNSFARRVLDKMHLDENSIILELGSGFGNDAMFFANNSKATVIGVDSSQAAITQAQKNPAMQQLRGRVNLACSDFLGVLEQSRGSNLSMVYSHSTLHYSPPLILREKTFPLIADVLRPNEIPGSTPGTLCFAMKIGTSASAKAPNQNQLLPGSAYNPSVDMKDKVFRIYPETKSDVLNLVEPSFDVQYARLVPVKGYDKNGDTEMFCYVIATPKTKEDAA